MAKFLDDTGLGTLWTKIKALIPTNNNQLTNGAGYITNGYMGYINSTDKAIYIPKGWNYTVGSSNYVHTFAFIVQDSSSVYVKTNFNFREIGSTSNIHSLGTSILIDGTTITTGGQNLSNRYLYLCWHSDGTTVIKSVALLSDLPTVPTTVSSFTNDSGYITSSDIPTTVSTFTNDAGYITSSSIPTTVSSFTNDSGYITSSAIASKQDAPSTAGTAGQVLTLDSNLDPTWASAQTQPEVFVGSTTPSGYTIYIDPEDAIPSGEGANF